MGKVSVFQLLWIALALVIPAGLTGCAGLSGMLGGNNDQVRIMVRSKSQVVQGLDEWMGPGDCSAVAVLSRDDAGLTIKVRVQDDILVVESEEPYQNDGIELYFDVRPGKERGTSLYDKGVFQAIVAALPGKTEKKITFYNGRADNYPAEVEGAEVTRQFFPDGYEITVFLPYEGFQMNHYRPGLRFHFALGINDVDSPTAPQTQLMSSGTAMNWEDAAGFSPVVME